MHLTRDPTTAYLSMHIDLIREAESDLGARLSARGAEGYLQALYDLQRIQPGTYSQHLEEIGRAKEARIAALGGGTVGALSIFIELFGNDDAAPKLTEFFVSTYADKRGETPTEAQRVEIKNAVEAMVQFPPSNRTLNNFIALLRDSDVIFSCASALRDSEAVAHYLQS